jgi:hypothetical protein
MTNQANLNKAFENHGVDLIVDEFDIHYGISHS